MKEKNGDNTRTVDAKVLEIKEKNIVIVTDSGEKKEIKKEMVGSDIEVGDTLEVVIKDKPFSHRITQAKLITRGEPSMELLKLVGLASVVLIVSYILMYSGFLTHWYSHFREIMMTGSITQKLEVANILTNLIGVFVIATLVVLSIIWKIYIRDEEMKSEEILKLLAIVTLASIVCYSIVYISFYNSWSVIFKEVMISADLSNKLLISEIMSKLLGIFVIGSLMLLNIIWSFYIHHKKIEFIEDSKKE